MKLISRFSVRGDVIVSRLIVSARTFCECIKLKLDINIASNDNIWTDGRFQLYGHLCIDAPSCVFLFLTEIFEEAGSCR